MDGPGLAGRRSCPPVPAVSVVGQLEGAAFGLISSMISTLLYQSGFDGGDRFFIAYVRAMARYFGAVRAKIPTFLPTSVASVDGAARDFGLYHGLDAGFV